VPDLKEILYFGSLPAPEHTHAQQQHEHMHIAQRICLNMVSAILSRPVLCSQQTSVLSLDAYFRSNELEFSHDPVHPRSSWPLPAVRLLTCSPSASTPSFVHQPNTRPPDSLPYSRLAASSIREGYVSNLNPPATSADLERNTQFRFPRRELWERPSAIGS